MNSPHTQCHTARLETVSSCCCTNSNLLELATLTNDRDPGMAAIIKCTLCGECSNAEFWLVMIRGSPAVHSNVHRQQQTRSSRICRPRATARGGEVHSAQSQKCQFEVKTAWIALLVNTGGALCPLRLPPAARYTVCGALLCPARILLWSEYARFSAHREDSRILARGRWSIVSKEV